MSACVSAFVPFYRSVSVSLSLCVCVCLGLCLCVWHCAYVCAPPYLCMCVVTQLIEINREP